MKSVWIVEKGEYSDYGVMAIFETEGQAKEFSEHLPGSSYREWELDTWTEEQATFRIDFNLQGEITGISEMANTDEVLEESTDTGRHKAESLSIYVNRGPRDRAIKISSERFYKIRAFLDEADERVKQALPETAEHLRVIAAKYLAEVLAGLRPVPTLPCKGFDEMVLKALNLPQ